MLESITIMPTIRRMGERPNIDIGSLAEALLFYDTVHLYVFDWTFTYLAVSCGVEPLVRLVSEGHLKLTYEENSISTLTALDDNGREVGHGTGLSDMTPFERIVPGVFGDLIGRPGKGRRLANKLAGHTTISRQTFEWVTLAEDGLCDDPALGEAIRPIIAALFPEYILPSIIEFNVHRDSEHGLVVESNLNFDLLTQLYRRRLGKNTGGFGAGTIINDLLNAEEQIHLAAQNNSELATSPLNSLYMRRRIENLITAGQHSSQQISHFQEHIFDSGNALREAINSDARTFADLLPVLDKARRWKEWLRGQPPDIDLIRSYYHKVSENEPYLRSLPQRAMRWLLFAVGGTVIGAVNPLLGLIAGLGGGAIDTFLVDHLIRGWKPNQFVEGPLRGLLSGSTKSQ